MRQASWESTVAALGEDRGRVSEAELIAIGAELLLAGPPSDAVIEWRQEAGFVGIDPGPDVLRSLGRDYLRFLWHAPDTWVHRRQFLFAELETRRATEPVRALVLSLEAERDAYFPSVVERFWCSVPPELAPLLPLALLPDCTVASLREHTVRRFLECNGPEGMHRDDLAEFWSLEAKRVERALHPPPENGSPREEAAEPYSFAARLAPQPGWTDSRDQAWSDRIDYIEDGLNDDYALAIRLMACRAAEEGLSWLFVSEVVTARPEAQASRQTE